MDCPPRSTARERQFLSAEWVEIRSGICRVIQCDVFCPQALLPAGIFYMYLFYGPWCCLPVGRYIRCREKRRREAFPCSTWNIYRKSWNAALYRAPFLLPPSVGSRPLYAPATPAAAYSERRRAGMFRRRGNRFSEKNEERWSLFVPAPVLLAFLKKFHVKHPGGLLQKERANFPLFLEKKRIYDII